jgi:cell division transport system ATP-binding protein
MSKPQKLEIVLQPPLLYVKPIWSFSVSDSLMIQLCAVSKVYPPTYQALSDVNLSIDPREFVFLIGPSGAGKTTLLRLLYRAEDASAGDITVNGRNVGRLSSRGVAALRREIGLVFQDFKLLPTMSAVENVALAAEVAGRSARDSCKRAQELLDQFGLGAKCRLKPPALSGGEQQIVAIARALVNDPVLVLADEPTASLDAEAAGETMRLFARMTDRGITVVIASHDGGFSERLPCRTAFLENGRLLDVTNLAKEAAL